MKTVLLAIGFVLSSGLVVSAEQKTECRNGQCRIVESPRKVLREGKEVVEKVIQSPAKVAHVVKRSKPVRSFLLRVFR